MKEIKTLQQQISNPVQLKMNNSYKEERRINIKTIHFPMKVERERIIDIYFANITPDIYTMKSLRKKVIAEMIKGNPRIFDASKFVYNGGRHMYSFVDLQLNKQGNNFQVKWNDNGRDRKFSVYMKKLVAVKVHDLLENLVQLKLVVNQPTIKTVDIAMKHLASIRYITINQCIFLNPENNYDFLQSEYAWFNFSQPLPPAGWKDLQLNLNVHSKKKMVVDIICEICEIQQQDLSKWNMTSTERKKINKALKGLKVEGVHTFYPRKYFINGLSTKTAANQIFLLQTERGRKIYTVKQYFLERYQKVLMYPNLPCLCAPSSKGPIFLPIEVCHILGDQKRLPRKREIAEIPDFIVERDVSTADEFKNGSSNLQFKKFHNPVPIRSWGILMFELNEIFGINYIENFTRKMLEFGHMFGFKIERPHFQKYFHRVEDVCPVFEKIQHCFEELQLLVVILPEKSNIYGEIKTCGKNVFGTTIPCLLINNAIRTNLDIFGNVFLKINTKLGGTNNAIQRRSLSSK